VRFGCGWLKLPDRLTRRVAGEKPVTLFRTWVWGKVAMEVVSINIADVDVTHLAKDVPQK
jgi:hypothetical protein